MYNIMSLPYMIIESACVIVDVAHCVIYTSKIMSDNWLAYLVFFSIQICTPMLTMQFMFFSSLKSWEWTSLTIKEISSTTKWVYQQNRPCLICWFKVFTTFPGECCNFQTIVFGRTVSLTFKMYSIHVYLPTFKTNKKVKKGTQALFGCL